MAINGSGIRDTARVLEISPTTVINELKKKESCLESVNRAVLNSVNPQEVVVDIQNVEDPEAELDAMWSYVQSKEHQRWLWHAIDHNTGKILAYTLGDHKDEVFLKLKELLEPFGITDFTRMTGEPMNATCHPNSIQSVKRILNRSNGNTSPYGRALKD